MEYHAEPMTTTATTKVSVLLNTQDDWWNWNRKIIKLARDHETLDILLRRVPRPVEPTHPNDFEPDLTNQNAALAAVTAVQAIQGAGEEDESSHDEDAAPALANQPPPQTTQ
jgi:hypothetical protein